MREIKFQYLFKFPDGTIHRLTQTLEQLEQHRYIQYNLEKGCSIVARREYTGLRDKNGKEIYEGDILNSEEEVVWVGNGWFVKELEESWEQFLVNGVNTCAECQNRLGEHCEDYAEVIGNIYENPELLEKCG